MLRYGEINTLYTPTFPALLWTSEVSVNLLCIRGRSRSVYGTRLLAVYFSSFTIASVLLRFDQNLFVFYVGYSYRE